MRNSILAIASISLGCAGSSVRYAQAENIVFASTRTGNTDIYLATAGKVKRLTTDTAADRYPRCSPTGDQIVFVRGDGRNRDIYRIDFADGKEHRLTSGEGASYTPVWSADGRRIFFTRGASRAGEFDRIAEMRPDGDSVRFLTDGVAHDVHPAPSSDGRWLLFHSYRYGHGNTELVLLELASGQIARITDSPSREYEGAFAGDSLVVFSSNQDGGYFRLYVKALPSGSIQRFIDTGADAWGARVSRGGDVLFHSGQDDGARLFRTRLGTNSPRRVLADGFPNFGGDWCVKRR